MSGTALVVLPPVCPSCGGDLVETTTWQPPLFVGCDYGQVTASPLKRCHSCGWWIATGQQTVNPRVFA